jgi:hydroxypyruvate reductase
VIEKYRLQVSPAVRAHLDLAESETPKPGDPCFDRVSTRIVASAKVMLEGAATFLEGRAIPTHILGDRVEGESTAVARTHADLARQIAQGRGPWAPPCALLSGGETTVTIRGSGRGGSNLEYLLGLIVAMGETAPYAALACDTDGSDGSTGVAGALADETSLHRAAQLGLDPAAMLHDNDSQTFFEALGDLIVTGPTFNNVNDLRVLLVSGP